MTEQPYTVVINVDDSQLMSVDFEGSAPISYRVIIRDWSRGSEPDEHGDLYEDREL